MTTDITTTAEVTAVVIILTTLLLLVIAATKVFSRSRTTDSNGGAGVVPNVIPDASSSSSSSKAWKYDVFISFRGEDTRKTFVDHLYSGLQQHGILTYKDDVTFDRGDTIAPALLSAIRESYIALIIFSENYADSSWCLDELTHIMKCKEDSGQIGIPIFNNVDPWDVRKQKGQFGKAFAKHKSSKINKKKVESWKKALVDASNIAGWESKHVANGHEAKFIKEIVGSILDKLSSPASTVEDENLVGMGIRLEELKFQLEIGSGGGVRMVGIWGLGGGGKTTLATSLYKKFSPNFDGSCFLGNIREETQKHGLKGLQEKILSTVFGKPMQVESVELGKDKIKQMLCRRKVLIVLDDVDHLEQLEALAGYRKWFGEGSRVIITTRDQHLLTTSDEIEVSPISLLSHEEAVRLFNKRAYNAKKPVEDYDVLSQEVVTYAGGLPLALIVLGSFLHDKDKDEWLSTLDRLKYHPEMGILEKLKISYDGLKDVEKKLFLDIACFHRWGSKNEAMKILDACGFYPAIGVKVLIQKALIVVTEYQFEMHDLVLEMGHYIARGEHPNNPEKYSRVWRNEDIEDICSRNATMENDKIEAIQCAPHGCSLNNFILHVSNMKKLRFLKVTYTNFDEGPSFLSNELRYLFWESYPASTLPESFQPMKLLVLRMDYSWQLKALWKGYKYLPCLKELELSRMNALVRTPDFGGLPCVQKLILDCESLEEIHESLGNHASLVYVEVRSCKLTRFPSIVGMEKLEILIISDCETLVEFPKIEAKMDSLVTLSLTAVGIEILPSTIGEYCTNLTSLSLECCSKLKSIDGNSHTLKGLQNLEIHSCEKFPKDLFNGILDGLGLRKLKLTSCNFKDGEIPTEIGELSNLRELILDGYFTRLDFSLLQLTRLKVLGLSCCENLVELPELPSSLVTFEVGYGLSLEVIKDYVHRRCEWLSDVSMLQGKNKTGGERLLETMLQGKAVKSGCMFLRLPELEIRRGFEPRLVRGDRCRMQLPENWYNDFYGFLFCAVTHGLINPVISMKHMEKSVDSQDDDDVYWEENEDYCITWVTYVSFSLLRNTSWWNPTSTAVEMELDKSEFSKTRIGRCGLKLVPKGATARTTHSRSSSSSDDDDDYKCTLHIRRDSKSVLNFKIHGSRKLY